MASSEGTDAARSALEASYLPLLKQLSPSHQQRLDGEAIGHLRSSKLWKQASVVLLYPRQAGGVRMDELARRAFEDGKRVGLSVSRPFASRAVTEADASFKGGTTSKDPLARTLDFIEIHEPSCACMPRGTVELSCDGTREASEGSTTGFSCAELFASLCVVPGLVFDRNGFRIAADQSLYDRFLAFYPGYKVALVHSMQVSGNPLPHGSKEIPVDYVISDGSVWRCRRRVS